MNLTLWMKLVLSLVFVEDVFCESPEIFPEENTDNEEEDTGNDPTQTPSKDNSFAIERYTKDENFTMAHLRCANFDGSLLRVAKLKNTRILSSSTENDINWVGIRFPNSSFRWYNNETGALQIIDCLTGLNPNLERCVFLECCNKITGVCSVQCFDRTCNACGNSSFVIYICTKGLPVTSSSSDDSSMPTTMSSAYSELFSTPAILELSLNSTTTDISLARTISELSSTTVRLDSSSLSAKTVVSSTSANSDISSSPTASELSSTSVTPGLSASLSSGDRFTTSTKSELPSTLATTGSSSVPVKTELSSSYANGDISSTPTTSELSSASKPSGLSSTSSYAGLSSTPTKSELPSTLTITVSPTEQNVSIRTTKISTTESTDSRGRNQTMDRQVDDYKALIDDVDINQEDALSEMMKITSKHIEHFQNDVKGENGSSLSISNIFERRLTEYAEQHLRRHNGAITRRTTDFVIQMRNISSASYESRSDFIFPEDTFNTKRGLSPEDFIVIPKELFSDDFVFVGVLYFTLDRLLTDAHRDFKDEQLNSKIISAEMSPKPQGTLERNVTFTLRHRNNSGNGSNCVFIQHSKQTRNDNPKLSNVGCSVMSTNDNHTNCTCNHMTSFAVLTRVRDSGESKSISSVHKKALSVITYVGITLSLVGETLTVASYVFFIGFKIEQAHLHTNLAFSLGLAQVFFLTGSHANGYKVCCLLVAALIHYFYLVTFCWMLVEGYHLYLMVVKVFNEGSYLKKYYLFSWVTPLVIVIMSVIAAALTLDGVQSYVSDHICWVSAENYFIWSFLGPVLLVCLVVQGFQGDPGPRGHSSRYVSAQLVRGNGTTEKEVNLVLLFLVAKEITRMNKTMDGPSLQLRKSVKACLLLFPILGTTWVLSVLTMIRSAVVLEYIFNIFNSLQGFMIFLFHVVRSTEIHVVFQRRRARWDNSRDLSNHLSTFQKPQSDKSAPLSASSVKPSLGNWVETNESGSPDFWYSTGRTSKNQIMPAVDTPT